MELVVIAGFVCLTVLWITRKGLSFAPVLVVRVEYPSPAVVAAKPPDAAEKPLPESVEEYAQLESSEFAKDAIRQDARDLYEKLGNWDVVLAQLTTKYGD